MSAMTDYTEALLANWLLRMSGNTGPTAHFLGLFTGAGPTDAAVSPYSDDNEVATGSGTYPAYARQSIVFGSPEAATGIIKNSNTVVFPANTGGGAAATTITYWGVFDAVTNGNLLCYGALNSSKTIDVSDVPSFPAESLILTFA
jgi:hypothetical protein